MKYYNLSNGDIKIHESYIKMLFAMEGIMIQLKDEQKFYGLIED